MSQLNTLALRDALITRVTDFALDDHFVRDEALAASMRQIWSGPPETGGLGSDLWVEGAFPSIAAAETMEHLASRNLVHKDLAKQLDKVGAFPMGLRPYQHQLESIECAARRGEPDAPRPGIVVTAGTGAGKTESFLIPMLNDLWDSPGQHGGGMSALILYPMNALVNDQVGRLDKWLRGQNRLSFFHFTSETPENAKFADNREIPPATAWRFRTRQQARGWEDAKGKVLPSGDGPNPDIVVTNYSMLEYMLCRPQDGVFFGSNLRVVILDEAHIYSGNLAAEITLLLRRVLMRCGRKPEEVLFIATSATIGGGEQELKPFAAKLFSKPEELVHIVVGKQQRPVLQAQEASLPLSDGLSETLAENPLPDAETMVAKNGELSFRQATEERLNRWRDTLGLIVPSAELDAALESESESRRIGPLLAKSLTHSGAVAALQGVLWNDGMPQRLPLRELAERIFGKVDSAAIEATRQILQVGAVARLEPGALPLVPNRIHYLMRGPEGLMMAFGPSTGDGLSELEEGRSVFSAGADPSTVGNSATHPLTLFRCNESGWWGVAGKQVDGCLEPVPSSVVLYGDDEELDFDVENPNALQQSKVRFFSLSEVEGCPSRWFDPATGRYGASGGVQLWEVGACPISGSPLTPSAVGWFSARARLQLSVVAETALASMPEYPDDTRAWKPARGRRLLVFSDSRAEAARLGPRLTRQHELQVFRAAVMERLQNVNLAANDEERLVIESQIEGLKKQIETASPALRIPLQAQLDLLSDHLRQMGEGGSVSDWVAVIRESEVVSELFYAPGGKGHQPGDGNSHDIWSSNSKEIRKSLGSLLGRELARRPAWPSPSLETLGLVEVVYPGIAKLAPPPEILGVLPADVVARIEVLWPDYIAALLDAVRNQGAITLGSEDDDRDYQYGNGFLGKLVAQDQAFRRSMIPLIGEHVEGPQTSRRNSFTRSVLVSAGLDQSKAVELTRPVMKAAFASLAHAAESGELPWLRVEANAPTNSDHAVTALQIVFPKLGLRRPARLFQCERTGQVWPRSVAGLYPGSSTASLHEVGHDEIDGDARLGRRRRELRDWLGFKLGLWAEEHSAQLSPDENARLQDLFREGSRNILSSTTTLELGIDIGGLSAVLLGNLPPGKANYLQRAGRAGRRADGTSAVLGFARPSAYEREVFLDFRRYLEQELRRPTVFLDRAPLVRRHAHAWLLGEFFQEHSPSGSATGAMDAYGKMGAFTGQPLPSVWKSGQPKPVLDSPNSNSVASQFLKYLEDIADDPPAHLQAELARLWSGCDNVDSSSSLWSDNIRTIHGDYRSAIDEWLSIVADLVAAWEEIEDQPSGAQGSGFLRAQANAIFFQLLALHKLTVIESLADARVLPRYGFPIGLSRLRVQVPDGPKRTREEDQFRLQRDGMMALREYTPGSQLLVGGQVITSRGLLKHWTGAVVQNEAWGLRGRFVKTSAGFFDYSLSANPPQTPPTLGQGARVQAGDFLFPRHGFTTAAWDPPRYGSDFERVGELEVFTLAFASAKSCDPPVVGFGGITGCVATYRDAGELLLLNSGAHEKGFAICQKCGFAESEWKNGGKGRLDLPGRFDLHAPLNASHRGRRCWEEEEAPVWRNHHLAAKQTTNLLKIDFGGTHQPLDRELLYTLGQVLRLSGASILELDERELGVLDPAPDAATGQYRSVVLFDSLAGGSGHLAELSHPEKRSVHRQWFDRAVDLLTVEGEMSDAVRHREAIRRLLTSSCNDSLLVPERALALLLALRSGDTAINDPLPAEVSHVLALADLENGEIPDVFEVFVDDNEIAGVSQGPLALVRWGHSGSSTLPEASTIAVLRLPQGGVAIGRWFYQRRTDADHPHRIRLRRLVDPVLLELTDEEFQDLQIIATRAPSS